jgi:hypothetical protein
MPEKKPYTQIKTTSGSETAYNTPNKMGLLLKAISMEFAEGTPKEALQRTQEAYSLLATINPPVATYTEGGRPMLFRDAMQDIADTYVMQQGSKPAAARSIAEQEAAAALNIMKDAVKSLKPKPRENSPRKEEMAEHPRPTGPHILASKARATR